MFIRRNPLPPIAVCWDQDGLMLAQLDPYAVRDQAGPVPPDNGQCAPRRLRALARRPLPNTRQDDVNTTEMAQAVRALVEQHVPGACRALLCLGPTELFVYTVRMPVMPAEELGQAVRWEARERLPYPLEEAELRHVPTTTVRVDGEIRQETIVLACHHDVLARSIRIAERAGLEPVAVDVQASAVLRCVPPAPCTDSVLDDGGEAAAQGSSAGIDRPPLNIVVHVGPSCSTVAAGAQGRLAFLKYVRVGAEDIDTAVARAVELSPADARRIRLSVMQQATPDLGNEVHRSILDAVNTRLEALAAEIQLCLQHLKVTYRGHPWPTLWLSGHEATHWTAHFLSLRLGVPVTLLDPFEAVAPPAGAAVDAVPVRGVWTAVCGLALHPLADPAPATSRAREPRSAPLLQETR